jgi:hypothetical protein
MDFFPQKFSRAAGPSALPGAGGKIAAPAFDLPRDAAYKNPKISLHATGARSRRAEPKPMTGEKERNARVL